MAPKENAAQGQACYVGVGANIAPQSNIMRALTLLDGQRPVRAVSTFYRTRAINRPEQPDYLNGVVFVACTGTPHALKFDVLRKIESDLGRIRTSDKWAARPIDLDILLWGDLVVHEPGLVVPDPDILSRPFIAAALLELVPEMKVPGSNVLLNHCANAGELKQLEADEAFSKALKERFTP